MSKVIANVVPCRVVWWRGVLCCVVSCCIVLCRDVAWYEIYHDGKSRKFVPGFVSLLAFIVPWRVVQSRAVLWGEMSWCGVAWRGVI